MFRPDAWAKAFIITAGTIPAAEESLEYLRGFCRIVLMLPGDVSGRSDARRLGECITAALTKTSLEKAAVEKGVVPKTAVLAKHFVQLILQRYRFPQYKLIIRTIEKEIYKQKGIEEVFVETALEPDEAFLAMVKEKALRITGAKDIKLTPRLIPGLIGGVRLRWGSLLYDGSVKRRLHNLAQNLSAFGNYGLVA